MVFAAFKAKTGWLCMRILCPCVATFNLLFLVQSGHHYLLIEMLFFLAMMYLKNCSLSDKQKWPTYSTSKIILGTDHWVYFWFSVLPSFVHVHCMSWKFIVIIYAQNIVSQKTGRFRKLCNKHCHFKIIVLFLIFYSFEHLFNFSLIFYFDESIC